MRCPWQMSMRLDGSTLVGLGTSPFECWPCGGVAILRNHQTRETKGAQGQLGKDPPNQPTTKSQTFIKRLVASLEKSELN